MKEKVLSMKFVQSQWLLFVIAGGLLFAAPSYAHHAFAAEYDINQQITIKGNLTSFEWVNPHAWLHVDVKGDDGKVVNWAVEFGSPNSLYRRGFRKTDFPTGTTVVIDGYRAKNGTHTVNARSVKLPDGRNLFSGGSAPDQQ